MDRKELLSALEVLENCGVDTAQEQKLLQANAETPVVLVAGTQAARPLDLLTGLEISVPDTFVLSFPLLCVYGEKFHIQAEDRAGERHHFSDWADFLAFLDKDPERVSCCTLSAPSRLLAQVQLRFLILDGREDLTRSASDCRGFLTVLPCAAGAPGDRVEALCRWAREVRAMPGQVGAVLNHTETGMTNAMLPLALRQWLGTEVPSWRCGYPASGKSLPPAAVLEQAVRRLTEAETAGTEEQMLSGCRDRSAAKALAQEQRLEQEAEEKRQAAAWLVKCGEDFRAIGESTGAVVSCTLTNQQEKAIREDVNGLADLLREQLLLMSRELLEKRGADAKADLRNLGGDYIEDVCGRYLSALVDHISQELWKPKIEAAFQQSVEEYRTLVRSAPVSLLEADPEGMTRILKAIDVNLGAYQDPMAAGLGSVVGGAVYFGLNLLLSYSGVGFLGRLFMAKDVKEVAQSAGQAVTTAVEQIISPESYVEKLTKALQNIVSKMPARIYSTLTSSIIPMLNADIARQYQSMIDRACGALVEQADVLTRDETRLLERRNELNTQRLRLLEL